MILRIDSNCGIIKIGSPPEELPGIFESIKISGSLLKENLGTQGRSGMVKIVHGWDDADVLIKLSLIDNPLTGQSRWDCLNQIASIFKKVSDNGKPEIYTLSHPMINAWSSRRLLFSTLESSEWRRGRKIALTLSFEEYDSAPGLIQARQAGSNSALAINQEALDAARERMLVSDGQRSGLGRQEARFANL